MPSESAPTFDLARAALLDALAWQVELGADAAIGDAPVDRFEAAERAPRSAPAAVVAAEPAPAPAGLGTAELAAGCADLASLRAVMGAFDGCALKAGARNLV